MQGLDKDLGFFSYKFLEAIESFLCSGIIRLVFCKQYSSLWMENRLDDRTRLEWRDHLDKYYT